MRLFLPKISCMCISRWVVMRGICAVLACYAFHALAEQQPPPEDTSHLYDWVGDWARNDTRGGINLSTFIFMDIDRDGDYTAADKPMAGIITELYRGDEKIAQAYSNSNGWCNFRLSRFEQDAVIREEGAYQFRVAVPKGWRISSNNAQQPLVIKPVYGSIGGMGAERMPDPIGLMPILSVQGQVSNGKAGQAVYLRDAVTGAEWQAALDDALHFYFEDVPAAEYSLHYASRVLPVSVSRFPLHLGDVSADRAISAPNQIAHFDDIEGGGLRKVPHGYAGVRWFNLNAMRKGFTANSVGYINGTISRDFHAYTSSGHPARIYADAPFALHEMAVSVAWCDAHGETMEVVFYEGEKQVGSDSILLSCLAPVIYRPERENITAIDLRTKHYWQAVLDDVALSAP
jgi:hypothetical protein